MPLDRTARTTAAAGARTGTAAHALGCGDAVPVDRPSRAERGRGGPAVSSVRASLSASLPGYDLGGELGRGGWGVVRDGRRRASGEPVAIKELPPAYVADRAVR